MDLTDMHVCKSDLGPITFLAEGKSGKFFRVDQFHLPGDPAALIFKEFTADVAAQIRSAQTSAEFRIKLNLVDRAVLDRYFVWPRALVSDAVDGISGLLMPLIPPEFFGRQVDPESGEIVLKLRNIVWLTSSEKQRTAAFVDLPNIDKTERLILLAQLACAIELLHKHEWVYGDLHFRSAVFALNPPKLLMLDCGCSGALTDLSRGRFFTPFWDPPELSVNRPIDELLQKELPDSVTDVYKLGLAILRCLTPGKGATTSRAVSRLADELDGEGSTLLERAISADRASRPTAMELFSYFDNAVSRRIGVTGLIRTRWIMPTSPANIGHVFISYVSDDSEIVDRLQHDLESFGIAVWRDRSSLGPGDRWKDAIRNAIAIGTFFLCCFSESSRRRSRSYMNEELTLAVEELRIRDRAQTWFLPVVLPGGEVPDWPISSGESLRDFNYTVLSLDNWTEGISRLVLAIRRS